MGDRTPRLEHEPDSKLSQLLWVLPRGSHRWSISFPQDITGDPSLHQTQNVTRRGLAVAVPRGEPGQEGGLAGCKLGW